MFYLDEVLQYQASGDSIADTDLLNSDCNLPAAMYELNDPWDKFEGKICIREPNGVDT